MTIRTHTEPASAFPLLGTPTRHSRRFATCAALLALTFLTPAPVIQAQSADAASNLVTHTAALSQMQAEEPATNANAVEGAGTNETGETSRSDQNAIVLMGRDAELKAGETAEAIVVIGGSAKVHGKVNDAVVVIGGDAEVYGEVGDAVVAILGNVKAGKGAKIHGDTVAIGGTLEIAKGVSIGGQKVNIGVAGLHIEWLRQWFVQCVLKLRPLAPQVGWIWCVAGVFFLIYLLVAAAFPRPVQACVNELTRRPATTFLFGLLTKMLVPMLTLLLAITMVGLVIVPFISAALFLGAIVGKVALLEWFGMKLGRQTGSELLQKPLIGFLIGVLILTLLYNIPVLGLVTYLLFSVWGLGCGVTAAFAGMRREIPQKSAPLAPRSPAWPVTASGSASLKSGTPGGAVVDAPSAAQTDATLSQPGSNSLPPDATSPTPSFAPTAANVPEAFAYPRAGFWERLGAGFLDMVLVCVLAGFAHGFLRSINSLDGPPLGFLIALAYFAGMWTWKGTTVGGIVLGLKVARLDGQPVTFAVALVRALAAAFSMLVLFLGFLWIAWDSEKQGWHDRIAGTIVLRLPRGQPLVCL